MRRSQYLALTATAVAALGTVGYGAATSLASPAHTAKAARPMPALKLAKVSVKQGSGAVKASVLVNAKGRAVYLLTGDSVEHPLCTSTGCLGAWPAVTSSVAKPVVGPGVKGKLTVWKHKGMHQLVLNGHPLYTFAGDKSAGVANGQGLASGSDVWKVLGAGGAAAPIASAPAGSGTGTSGTATSGSTTPDPGSSTPAGSNAPTGASTPSGSAPATPSGVPASPTKTTPSGSTTPSGQTTPSGSTTPSGTTTPPAKTTPSGTTTPSTTTPSTTTPSGPPPVDNWA